MSNEIKMINDEINYFMDSYSKGLISKEKMEKHISICNEDLKQLNN